MRSGIRRIELHGGIQLLERGVLLAKVVPGRTQTVMRVSPLWSEPQCGFELFSSLFCIPFIFEGQSQVVVCRRIVGFKSQGLTIICDGLVPRFCARKFDGLLTVTLGSLRKRCL